MYKKYEIYYIYFMQRLMLAPVSPKKIYCFWKPDQP